MLMFGILFSVSVDGSNDIEMALQIEEIQEPLLVSDSAPPRSTVCSPLEMTIMSNENSPTSYINDMERTESNDYIFGFKEEVFVIQRFAILKCPNCAVH
jgi:hypothetical protein